MTTSRTADSAESVALRLRRRLVIARDAAWEDWRVGATVAATIVALSALVAAWATPRGPLTTTEALLTLVGAFLAGGLAGFTWRSRWATLLAPMLFVAVFELARIRMTGPTVDLIHPTSTYGLIALVLGRGVHGLLALPPMALGTVYGRYAARRTDPSQQGRVPNPHRVLRVASRTAMATATLALVALAVLIARPASTPAVRDADGRVIPGSIAELASVSIGGHKQAMLIRGHSVEGPVLLYLAGGPGGTDIGAMRIFGGPLEADFVVVTWDQRGAGKSYPALDPTGTLTLQQMVDDTIEVTNYLRDRFGEEKIYLAGNSWGSTLGVLAAQARPELYHAFIGAGQMVSQAETDRLFYEDTLAYAGRTGNWDLASTLMAAGEPPYDDIWAYEHVLAHEREWNEYERVPEYEAKGEMPANLFVREYTLLEKLHALPAFLDTFALLYPQLQEIDFREDVRSLDVPVYIVAGRHEARGRAVLAEEWFDLLAAPSKEWVEFEDSGHRPHFEEPERFAEVMRDVLRDTYPGN